MPPVDGAGHGGSGQAARLPPPHPAAIYAVLRGAVGREVWGRLGRLRDFQPCNVFTELADSPRGNTQKGGGVSRGDVVLDERIYN